MRSIALPSALLIGACQPLTPCQQVMEDDGGERTGIVRIEGIQTVVAQIFGPSGLGRYPDGAPVVVYVHGAWSTNVVPLDEDRSHLNPGLGMIQLYLNLPGGQSGSAHDAPGINDRRGSAAREAVAVALQYADNALTDTDGCLLSERLHTPLSGQIALAGYSNGGNLAWSTLGDHALDLPEVVGVATYETPASSQFIVVESGTTENPSPVYVEGACALEDGGIVCDYDYDGLAFDTDDGVLFIDEESDGNYNTKDFTLAGVQHESRWYHSTQARQAAIDQDVTLSGRATPEDTVAFWQEREAPRQMPAAAERFPQLAGIATGSEIDHVLTGATDHPHVTGMIAAMESAGIHWFRLHPDRVYTTLISRSGEEFPEYPAGESFAVGQAVDFLPQSPTAHGEDYLTAAIIELLDRAHASEWGADLEAVLYR